jgi:hypothetical protein
LCDVRTTRVPELMLDEDDEEPLLLLKATLGLRMPSADVWLMRGSQFPLFDEDEEDCLSDIFLVKEGREGQFI